MQNRLPINTISLCHTSQLYSYFLQASAYGHCWETGYWAKWILNLTQEGHSYACYVLTLHSSKHKRDNQLHTIQPLTKKTPQLPQTCELGA